jgi:hypothetical protein
LNETFDVVCVKVMSKKRVKIVEDVKDLKASTSERRQRNGQKTTEARIRIRLTIYNAVLAAAAVSKRLLSGALSADKPMYAGSWRPW